MDLYSTIRCTKGNSVVINRDGRIMNLHLHCTLKYLNNEYDGARFIYENGFCDYRILPGHLRLLEHVLLILDCRLV